MAYTLTVDGVKQTVELEFDRLRALLKQGEVARVRDCCLALLSAQEQCVWPHLLLGNIALAEQHVESATNHFAQAAALEEPLRDEARAGLGRALFAASRHDEALQLLSEVLHSNPECHFAWLALGEGLVALGDYEGAWQCAERAVGVCSTDMHAVSLLIALGTRMSRHGDLISRLQDCLIAEPWNLDVRGAHALFLLYEQRYAEAQAEIARVQAFAPFVPVGPEIMKALRDGSAAIIAPGDA